MNLNEIFNEYIKINNEYVKFINEIINSNFEGYTEENITTKLIENKKKFEELMQCTDKIEIEEEKGVFLKDVKYSVIDGLFLAIDLYNFYYSKQLERFKMRAVNYIRKGRVTSFF
ncbi:MAG: hypothetical protein E7208_05265 [Clostridium butyricum]|nr:hypothetical protein [Clostridium butyricum]